MSNFVFNINDGDGFVTNGNFFGATQKIVNGVPKPRNGHEVAESIVEYFHVIKKGRFTPLTNKWDIISEGSEVIFTSKSDKNYDIILDVPEKDNRAKIKGEFIKKQDGNEPVEGIKQVNTLTIHGVVKVKGKLIVTFESGDVVIEKTINVSKDDSHANIASKIADAFSDLKDWNVTNDDGSSDVLFTAKEEGTNKDMKVTIENN